MNSLIPNKPAPKHFRALNFIEKLSSMPYGALFALWGGMAFFFAFLYFGLSFIGNGEHGPSAIHDMDLWHRFYNSLYYSIITATSTGYGDIVPHGFSKIVASMQSISALLVFAVFVTKLVSHQQELTLTEVHKLTFEDVFHNTREGMFIARKDFDHIMNIVHANKTLDLEHWENLTIAYRQLQTLFEEIPDFYQNEVHKYTIDEKREQLLLEASHRTLHRINIMLDTLSEANIDWMAHKGSMKELTELVRIVSDVTPLWRKRSPYEAHEAFEDILSMKERTHLKLLKAVQ